LIYLIMTWKPLWQCKKADVICMSVLCVIRQLKNDVAPFSHSLSYIAKKGDFYKEFSEDQKDFIDQVEPLNIEARYPSHKERLLKSLSKESVRKL